MGSTALCKIITGKEKKTTTVTYPENISHLIVMAICRGHCCVAGLDKLIPMARKRPFRFLFYFVFMTLLLAVHFPTDAIDLKLQLHSFELSPRKKKARTTSPFFGNLRYLHKS